MPPRHTTPDPGAGAGAEENALAAIVRSSQDAVIAKTPEGIVTAWNDSAQAIYGYPAQEILGRNIDITFPPESEAAERARHARVASGEAETGYRCVRLRADGRRVEVVMSMSPVRDGAGRVVGVASISRPVSAEERANARIASILDAAPDGMVCVDPDGTITMANLRMSALFGYDAAELIGLSIETLVPEELRARLLGLRDRFPAPPNAPSTGAGLPLMGQRRDGSRFPVEVSLSASSEGPGDDGLVIAAVRDVTEQRAAQAALLESETRLRQLTEHSPTVFTLRQIDPPAYLYISPGMEQLTGYRPEEIEADPQLLFDLLIHQDDRERARTLLSEEIKLTGRADAEYRLVRKDGAVRWVRSVTTLVPNPGGGPQRVVGMSDDITDRVLASQRLADAEADARAANDAKNRFLSRTSHELRTPLNAVLGFSQLLALSLRGTEHETSVEHVLKASRHLLALIDDVLDIAAIESGEMAVSIEPVSVSGAMEDVATLLAPLAAEAGVRLEVTPRADCLLLADTQRLRQVLLNLVSNAIKYHRPGGHVWLSWESAGQDVSIEVRDDGPGIPVDLQSRLFTPFDRLGAESTDIPGTGVGLAVTRSLAELMNGRVGYTPAPEGGARFTVTLPRAEGTAPITPGPTPVASDARVPGHPGTSTLLYIEDNNTNVQVMESVLGLRPAWQLMHAALGQLGIDLARAHQPDLVLLDLHLPDRPGLEVLRVLHQDPATREVPVVVVSADASHLTMRTVLEAGALRYLTKPYALEDLLGLLDEVAAPPTDGER